MAAGTMLYDLRKRRWSEELLTAFMIDASKLPEIRLAGEMAGTLLPELAAEIGLGQHVVIAVGGQDQKCAAMGAGLDSGIVTVSLGTACSISANTASLAFDMQSCIPCFSYLLDHEWVFEGVLNTAASCYTWLRDNFAKDKSYDELDRLAEDATEPCPTIFFPNLTGGSSPNWGSATGVFSGLSLNTNIGHLARSVMEGVGYGIRENLDVMRALIPQIDEIRIFGSGSKSDLWCEIIANITNINVVRLISHETALVGAAMLAVNAVHGKTPVPLSNGRAFKPEKNRVAAYDKAYEKYEITRMRYFSESEPKESK